MFDQPEDVILNPAPAWHGAGVAWHDDLNTQVRHTLRMRTHLSAKFKFSENTQLGPKFIA